jgi:hypothetical protein
VLAELARSHTLERAPLATALLATAEAGAGEHAL